MKYLLDTDTIIYFMKNLHGVPERIANCSAEDISISLITFSELLFGAFNSTHAQKNLAKVKSFGNDIRILPFCEKSAYIYAEQKALLKKAGKPIEDLDLMIASTAIHHNCTLITNNTKHFVRIKNLQLDNWCQDT